MQTVIGILVAILVFGVMIFIHEAGHYIVARFCHVTVLEFAVGMGPKILSRKSKKTGIVYSLRLLPIGGFTSMEGEDGENEDPHALVNRPKWQRFLVLFAGSFANILTGVIAMFIYLSITMNIGSTIVAEFQENALSKDAGLAVGDEIVRINGESMVSYNDIVYKIMLDGTEPLDITVVRNGETLTLEQVKFNTVEEEGMTLGEVDFKFLGVKPGFGVLVQQTFTQSAATVKVIYKTLIDLIRGKYGIKGVSGPVGTVSIISEATQNGFTPVLYLFTFISLNLGVMNLLPLPALDGGRILFLLVECIRRKPIKPEAEGYIHLAGMVVLLLFMAVITVFDIVKLF